MSIETGVLHVVATPIGNLGDISARALEVLAAVDLIAAEDTRHSATLLNHYRIDTPLTSLHEHNEAEKCARLIAQLSAGRTLALISDAGTPLISDPGYRLVTQARAAGIRVVPLPGACAAITALSAAGLPTDRFVFEGFLPARKSARRAQLDKLVAEPRTLVFYESSHRIASCIDDMSHGLGAQRRAAIARELTKKYEVIQGGTLAELGEWLRSDAHRQRGEFVILVEGYVSPDDTFDRTEAVRVLTVLLAELPLTKAAKLAAEITGATRNQLYKLGLDIDGND
ncbi:MAG: 16S rRNA (cytidine(1402)-2'-O)-methyltransferase [Gammaproteobacteria bacterium]